VRIYRLAAEDALESKNPDEALNYFELGVKLDPTWAQGWFNAALLAGEIGDYSAAVEHMQNYLELLPNAEDAQSARDSMDIWEVQGGALSIHLGRAKGSPIMN
jgi:tetratricopeptide (TPR) repeat protein